MSLTTHTFSKHLSECLNNKPPKKLLVALSGGVDSMCLTHLLANCRQQYPQLQLFAVTIDHAYRSESASEAIKVQGIVTKWGVCHQINKLSYSRDPKLIDNFEEVARTLRYENFRDICLQNHIDTVAVAHNLDDCLETFLQRLLMNSTMYGLAGLRTRAPMPIPHNSPNEDIQVIRPLLQFSKNEIRSYCIRNDIQWFEDLSNQNIALTQRNKLRYIINDYVPSILQKRPETSVLSKSNLIQTLLEIKLLVSNYETEKDELDNLVKLGNYVVNHKICSKKFSIPLSVWSLLRQEVAARWLYDTINPMSSSKHFHWAYAKIERQVIPKINSFIELSKEYTKFNYLGVIFDLRKSDHLLQFNLSKQPPIREEQGLKLDIPQDGSWVSFDRTWWFRALTSQKGLYLIWYKSLRKKELLAAFPELKKGDASFNSRIGNVPILMDSKNKVVGLPTHGLYTKGVNGKCVVTSF